MGTVAIKVLNYHYHYLGSFEANVSGHELQGDIGGVQAGGLADVADEVTHGLIDLAVDVQVHLVDTGDVGEAALHVVLHLNQEQRPRN